MTENISPDDPTFYEGFRGLSQQADQIAAASKLVVAATADALEAENAHMREQNDLLLQGNDALRRSLRRLIVLFAASVAVLGVGVGFQVYTVVRNRPVIDRIDASTAAVIANQSLILRNQAGIDEVVQALRDQTSQAVAAGGASAQPLELILSLLCSSGDPVRIATCRMLTPHPAPLPGG